MLDELYSDVNDLKIELPTNLSMLDSGFPPCTYFFSESYENGSFCNCMPD